MRIEGRAIVVPGDDIDTDVLYPGQFLNVTDVSQMTNHLFEGLDPTLRDRLGGDTALVVGANFGAGSSREHVPQAMAAAGVRFLVGRSFARIFYRNCINLGLPAVIAPAAVEAAVPDSLLALDLDAGTVEVDGRPLPVSPVPPFMREMFAAGGLVAWIGRRLGAA
jgi:3-isopropylmalate/(R)-2-methylmalate dehydratase small subunit